MRIHREKIAALLALLILLAGSWGIVRGLSSPVQRVDVPEIKIGESARKVLYKKYRAFTEESELARNPFSFAEGWQRMETTPMASPVMPPAPRPGVLIWPGATAAEAGVPWTDLPPADTGAKGEVGG